MKKIIYLDQEKKKLAESKKREQRSIKSLRLLVFYDGQSPACAKTIDLLKTLDWKNRIHFESFRNSQLLRLNKISEEKAEKRIVSITLAKNQKNSGIYTWFRIACNIPALWGAVPFLMMSIWLGFGQHAYDFFAKKRYIQSVEQVTCPERDQQKTI
ncbi:thiol-disulfide oxidoreductase DCC family protein [Bacillus sp. 179-C3.3 HS]|uniref:thiol-disulfide oxidoreductase DCC family protein n=1 Tax=Bacillus sp. 179-C3.3 HS TaxID=3232162 RepID=UPI0039A189D6